MRKEEISDADYREIRDQLDSEEAPLEIPETDDPSGKNTVSQLIEHDTVTGGHGHGGIDDQMRTKPPAGTKPSNQSKAR